MLLGGLEGSKCREELSHLPPICTYIHLYTPIYTYTYTHIHTYTHTHRVDKFFPCLLIGLHAHGNRYEDDEATEGGVGGDGTALDDVGDGNIQPFSLCKVKGGKRGGEGGRWLSTWRGHDCPITGRGV
jgi:hypothetical protein